MGLGPPVCTKCMVIGIISNKDDPRYGVKVRYGNSYWHCPICESPELDSNLWEYDLDIQDEIASNTIFLKFMKEGLKKVDIMP